MTGVNFPIVLFAALSARMSRSDNPRVQDGSDACQGSIRGNLSAAASHLSPVGRAGFLNWSLMSVSLMHNVVLLTPDKADFI